MIQYLDHWHALDHAHPGLAAELGHSDSLESVLAWMARGHFPPGSVDIVTQDEFSYDFLIRFPDSRWLVFGVN